MTPRYSDELLDARLIALLSERAEDVHARARPAEEIAADLAPRLRPGYRFSLEVMGALRLAWPVVIVALLLALLMSLIAGAFLRPAELVTVKIAIDMPIGAAPVVDSIVNGIRLAIRQADGRLGRFTVEIPEGAIFSDAVAGQPNAFKGAENMRRIAADPGFVAVIGPFDSIVANLEIPVTNGAGLLQCSPATTLPELTRSAGGGPVARLRADRPSFVRTVTSDAAQGRAAAHYLFESLGARSAYVLDEGDSYSVVLADAFTTEFAKLGVVAVGRATRPDTAVELATMMTSARAMQPDAIYFGGSSAGAAEVLKAAARAGLGNLPFVGGDALMDGRAEAPGSIIDQAGGDASSVFATVPAPLGSAEEARFESAYRSEFGVAPSPFAATGYACAQVVMSALQRVDAGAPADATQLREAVRAAGVDPTVTFDTILGPIKFDRYGDIDPQSVSVYGYDLASRNWAFRQRVDVPAPPGG